MDIILNSCLVNVQAEETFYIFLSFPESYLFTIAHLTWAALPRTVWSGCPLHMSWSRDQVVENWTLNLKLGYNTAEIKGVGQFH